MTLSLTGPLNRLDVCKIVNDFDQVNFKTAEELPKDQADRIFVIIQVERKLYSHHLPVVELIDQIMRFYLENSPSVVTLLMLYNTPAIVVLHPLPLSYEPHYINTASRSLIVQLKQAAAEGESYQQLMTWLFAHHFQKLTLDQKLDLIRRSNITPWEQKSISQKLELLGRIQAPTLLGKAKVKLQFLFWKVRFDAARAIKHRILFCTQLVTTLLFISALVLLLLTGCFCYMTGNLPFLYRNKEFYLNVIILSFAPNGVCLVMAGLGLALQIPIFTKSIREKGAWILSVNWNYLFLVSCVFAAFTGNCVPEDKTLEVSKKLDSQLLQLINTDNITVEQNAFANAHFPDLMDKWINLISPSDIDTGSLQTLQ